MTQQYIVGEFSSLLAGLQPAPDEVLGDAVGNLRREVEFGPLPMLPRLAREALHPGVPRSDECLEGALGADIRAS
jgi:hypothetical protein